MTEPAAAAQPRALALVDGEHFPDVVRDALAGLPYYVIGAVLVGGSEKLRGEPQLGVPLCATLEEGLALGPELVVDLSDEPVLDARSRLELAARVLAAGLPYAGADFRFDPLKFAPYELPAISVIGTGKRVGKTAVSGHLARLLARSYDVVVVAMGRGGPQEPTVVESPPDVAELLARARQGEHAASDFLEDAALAGVVTVGCRRCGGGMAGTAGASNIEAGAALAASLEPGIVLFEGSGTAIPPVATDARVLVVGAHQDPELVTGYLGAYRVLLADLIVLTNCEEPLATPSDVGRLRRALIRLAPETPTVSTVFRPRPVEDVAGRRVVVFTTAPRAAHARIARHLEEHEGAEVAMVSGNLADRAALRADLGSPAAWNADAYVLEIKAAAIDVAAEAAEARGIPVVFCDNEPVAFPGSADLDEALLALVPARARERARAEAAA